jgi:hypothetical protein
MPENINKSNWSSLKCSNYSQEDKEKKQTENKVIKARLKP